MVVDGACHCGAIAFTAEVEPHTLTLCHCTDCQAMSGSAFRANIPAPVETFRLLRGEPRIYVKVADSGARRVQGFCGDCGSQIYSCAADDPKTYNLRSGTLRQRAGLTPRRQIWVSSATPWARVFDDLPAFEKEPPGP